MPSAQTTTDHKAIRRWIEQRKGFPASVISTRHGDETGILRVCFDKKLLSSQLHRLAWDEFFAKFDAGDLAFLHTDKKSDGTISRFSKFVKRSHPRAELAA